MRRGSARGWDEEGWHREPSPRSASPRAAQTLVLAGKVRALLDGRTSVAAQDIREIVLPALRHRCLLNFEAEAEGVSTDEVITNIVETLPTEAAIEQPA